MDFQRKKRERSHELELRIQALQKAKDATSILAQKLEKGARLLSNSNHKKILIMPHDLLHHHAFQLKRMLLS